MPRVTLLAFLDLPVLCLHLGFERDMLVAKKAGNHGKAGQHGTSDIRRLSFQVGRKAQQRGKRRNRY